MVVVQFFLLCWCLWHCLYCIGYSKIGVIDRMKNIELESLLLERLFTTDDCNTLYSSNSHSNISWTIHITWIVLKKVLVSQIYWTIWIGDEIVECSVAFYHLLSNNNINWTLDNKMLLVRLKKKKEILWNYCLLVLVRCVIWIIWIIWVIWVIHRYFIN